MKQIFGWGFSSGRMLRMDPETKEALRILMLAVINGTNAIRASKCVFLSQDPNPEWFSDYDGFTAKMHTSMSREGISGLKLIYKGQDYSFFNVGYGQKPVGPSRATYDFCGNFSNWTGCLSWDEVKQFMAKLLADSKAINASVRG
jgi:hypothetical protein